MIDHSPVAQIMAEILNWLQHADLIKGEEDFPVLTNEDFVASLEESQASCYGKLVFEKEYNIQVVRWCLRQSWRCPYLRISKLGVGLFQFFFKTKDIMENVVNNGPLSIEDHMLILSPWTEQPLDVSSVFVKKAFWIQVTGLTDDWCSSNVGKKFLGHLKDCHIVQLREMGF